MGATELGARCCGDSTVNQSTAQASLRQPLPVTPTCHARPFCTYYLTTSMCYTTSAIYSLPPVTSSLVANPHSQPLTGAAVHLLCHRRRSSAPIHSSFTSLPSESTHNLSLPPPLGVSDIFVLVCRGGQLTKPTSTARTHTRFTIHKPSSPSPLLLEHN